MNKKAALILVLFLIFMQISNVNADNAGDIKNPMQPNWKLGIGPFGTEDDLLELKSRLDAIKPADIAVKEAKSWDAAKRIMYEGMKNREKNIEIIFTGKLSSGSNIGDLVWDCMFEVFNEDHYIYYNVAAYGCGYWTASGGIRIYITMNYRTTKEQEDYVTKEVKKILSQIISPGMSDRDKVKAVHDYILLNVEYDLSLERCTAYEALYDGKTVCQGYSLLGHRMLNEIGIPTRIIASWGMNHAWNLVKLDGKWYHMDITWDDPIPDREGRVLYNYFLLTDDEIKKDHFWASDEYPTSGEGIKLSLFIDVPFSHWANKEIENLARRNIVNGYGDGTFGPGDYITRAQAVVMLVNALGINYKGKTPNFKDVPPGYWAAGHIAAAQEKGIIKGYGDGTFHPGEYITRGQIAVMIVEAFDLKHTGEYKNFKDIGKSHWAYEHIEILASNGITNGYEDNTFRSGELTTRAHFSVFLSKCLAD